MRFAVIVAGAVLVSTAGLAQTGAGAAGAEEPQTNGERTVCRVFRETGSRLNRRRVCMSQNEWDQRDSQFQVARYQQQLIAPTEMRPAEAGAALRACPTC